MKEKKITERKKAVLTILTAKIPAHNPLVEVKLSGTRFVNLKSFAKNLNEIKSELKSIFLIPCNCEELNRVSTSICNKVKGNDSAVHSGSSYAGLQKLLACMDVPIISWKTYKKYETKVGQCIESKESCRRSIEEEKKLVLGSTEKILPPDIVEDILPNLQSLHSSSKLASNSLNQNNMTDNNNNEFNVALGDIMNIIVSYDTGWSKKGNCIESIE
ncbi:hypothetical protein TSAR_008060 [Trichomalopsis sarcophagae]|uniref:Uncharacterized protein n=1 Tax=Trichomalopsis sarcophagae TaxID=543379 RepID=A0A232FNZ0_9HYME|nr:hypothetical protein TSAR_008060 [Trichomalopsis sarcophagae]